MAMSDPSGGFVGPSSNDVPEVEAVAGCPSNVRNHQCRIEEIGQHSLEFVLSTEEGRQYVHRPLPISRRGVLEITPGGLSALLVGCITPVDYPKSRTLTASAISASESERGWQLNLTVSNSNTFGNHQADFHDVSVHVYSEDRELVCSEDIGTVSYEQDINNGTDVTLSCDQFPFMVTFSATESPCEETIRIDVLVYDRQVDGEYVWDGTYHRECNEGLPPEVDT